MKRRWRGGVLLGLALAGIGHGAWWYLPRRHAGRPPAAIVLLERSGGFPDRVWLAHPHQNLARLESRVGELGSLVDRLAVAAGTDAPVWPRLGPWPLPPSRSVTWARAADGGDLVVLEPYPLVRWLARAAGALAGNPWLAGGAVEATTSVRWESGRWILERGGARLPGALADAMVPPRRQLGGVAWEGVPAPWPAGPYALVARSGGLELHHPEEMPEAAANTVRAVPEAWRQRALFLHLRSNPEPTATAWLRADAGPGAVGLPAALAVRRGPPPPLPGEALLERIGVNAQRRLGDGWQAAAWDAAALEEAPRLLALLAEERAAAWLWMDVGALAGPGRDLGSLVEALAWLDPARARRWEAGLALAAAVPPGLELTVDLDEGPTHAVRVRLAEGPAGAAD